MSSSANVLQVTDVLHFLTTNDDNIQLLWLSERSGYRHLEMVTVATGSSKDVSDIIQHCAVERKKLTNGEWVIKQDQVSIAFPWLHCPLQCNTNIQVWVDEDKRLVYFMANVKTCLEAHL